MRNVPLYTAVGLLMGAGLAPSIAVGQSVSGYIGVDVRSFPNTTLDFGHSTALVGELRMRGDVAENLTYDLRLFGSSTVDGGAFDYIDPTVAKLTWQSEKWQVDLGYDLLFWGVTEGRNLVNIINQRNQVRDSLGDTGLGQSMLALRYFAPASTIEAFVLPRFEELRYGETGRPWSLGLPIDEAGATYESADGADNVDFALRYAGSVGNLEYAAFAFDGTLREPQYNLDATTMSLTPHYRQGQIFGVSAQYTAGPVLYKLETMHTAPDSGDDYWAAIAGLEYSVSSLFKRPWETSFFAEYNYDSRDGDPLAVFENDLFIGTQIRFPNTLGTELRLGAIVDLDDGDFTGSLSLQSRLTDNLRASADYIFIDASDPSDGLYAGRDDDQLSLKLEWHF
jgi:hypothetical protein